MKGTFVHGADQRLSLKSQPLEYRCHDRDLIRASFWVSSHLFSNHIYVFDEAHTEMISISWIIIHYGLSPGKPPVISTETKEVHLLLLLLLQPSYLSEILVILEIHHVDVVPRSIDHHRDCPSHVDVRPMEVIILAFDAVEHAILVLVTRFIIVAQQFLIKSLRLHMDHLLISFNVVKAPLVSRCCDFGFRLFERLLRDLLSLLARLIVPAPPCFKHVLHRVIVDVGVFDHDLQVLI